MRYLIGLLVTIGLLILLIVLIITSAGNKSEVKTTSKTLSSYSTTNATTRAIIDGPINAIPVHQQIQITVGQNSVSYVQLTGYNGEVAVSRNYSNTQNSYYNFLRALTVAGFTEGNQDPKLTNNTGFCPLGNRYNLQLIQNGKFLQNLWATTCGGDKTFRGSLNTTLELFKMQVPDYETLVQNLDIGV